MDKNIRMPDAHVFLFFV